jgi:hypothetical protein
MRDEYEKARKELGIPEADFALIAPHRYQAIVLRIIEQFTKLGKAGLKASWWWESLVDPSWGIQPQEPLKFVARYLDAEERYWFVAEAWMPPKKESNFWLYEATGSAILQILAETHHHEYYIVNKKMTWLLCENHHNVVIGCGGIERRDVG